VTRADGLEKPIMLGIREYAWGRGRPMSRWLDVVRVALA